MTGPKTPMPRTYLLHPHEQVMATALHPLEPKNATIGKIRVCGPRILVKGQLQALFLSPRAEYLGLT